MSKGEQSHPNLKRGDFIFTKNKVVTPNYLTRSKRSAQAAIIPKNTFIRIGEITRKYIKYGISYEIVCHYNDTALEVNWLYLKDNIITKDEPT